MSTQKQRRGFASMNPEKQRAIASAGGKAAHEQGLAHQFTSAEASAAGKKGGKASGAARRARRIDRLAEAVSSTPNAYCPTHSNEQVLADLRAKGIHDCPDATVIYNATVVRPYPRDAMGSTHTSQMAGQA